MWDGDEGAAAELVPLYVLLNGRTSPRNINLDLATSVIARPADIKRLEPEYQEIVSICGVWISIAEISAYLRLPLAITKVMVEVLLDQQYLDIGAPAEHKIALPLLEAVLAGLERL
ncbi:hypothetical protein GCM10022255_107000 [Dactylosporangium darangshiense]|uniref:DUF742 domain-containing protein n=2 Tax=Dactylosporangium darangshiense TaxID=579108 RepID=A0ABP8DTR3_9ACTN